MKYYKLSAFMYVLIYFFKTNQLEVITPEAAARQLGTSLHTLAFSETVEVGHINWKIFAVKLRVYDPNLQIKEVRNFRKFFFLRNIFFFFSQEFTRKAHFRME